MPLPKHFGGAGMPRAVASVPEEVTQLPQGGRGRSAAAAGDHRGGPLVPAVRWAQSPSGASAGTTSATPAAPPGPPIAQRPAQVPAARLQVRWEHQHIHLTSSAVCQVPWSLASLALSAIDVSPNRS